MLCTFFFFELTRNSVSNEQLETLRSHGKILYILLCHLFHCVTVLQYGQTISKEFKLSFSILK